MTVCAVFCNNNMKTLSPFAMGAEALFSLLSFVRGGAKQQGVE